VHYARSDLHSRQVISSQLPCSSFNLPTTHAAETGEGSGGRQNSNMDNVSSQDDVLRPRHSTQRLLPHSPDQLDRGSTGDDTFNVTPRPGGSTHWPHHWNGDVWFQAVQTRQRSTNNYRRHGDERCFVHYVPPGFSDAVHSRSSHHHPIDQFTAYRHDFHSASGQTVDL